MGLSPSVGKSAWSKTAFVSSGLTTPRPDVTRMENEHDRDLRPVRLEQARDAAKQAAASGIDRASRVQQYAPSRSLRCARGADGTIEHNATLTSPNVALRRLSGATACMASTSMKEER